ncbi:MAG: tetratricopeptide repeat protein [Deltaproteobacteria bacterium]|nr:tetratricopeptide repeat protein [Deltaproteobacteria bacterium]
MNLFSKTLMVFAWMLFLQWAAYGASSPFDSEREKTLNEIKVVNLTAFIPPPDISIHPKYFNLEEVPKELKSEKDYAKLEELFKIAEESKAEAAYVEADKFISQNRKSALVEYFTFFKADMIFEAQKGRSEPKYSLALEEYQDAVRDFPLHQQVPRALYQIGLSQLFSGFYSDVEITMTRAVKDFGSSELAPAYHLLQAEEYFLSKNDVKANGEFTFIIQKYPRSEAAIDAAFRKAFILFRKGEMADAYKVYQELEKFHSEVVENLKLKKDASDSSKFVDRIFYAETVYLNGFYKEAAELYQDLANLFPKHPLAPILLLRLASTYSHRGQVRSAEEMISYVLKKYSSDALVQSLGRMELADLFFVTKDLRAQKQNEKLYQEAYEASVKLDNPAVSSMLLAKLASHYMAFHIYPKAQSTLRQYKDLYQESANQEWVENNYRQTVEIEILDYYSREDYMAALATYLVNDRDKLVNFSDTKVLLKISDAAKRLSLYEKSAQILNRVVYLEKVSEARQEALLKLVDLLILQGEYRKASERLRRFNFAYPTTSLRYLYEMYWGKLYVGLKNNEQSIYHYEKALESVDKNPLGQMEIRHILMDLGELYEKGGNPGKAIEDYERFIRMIKSMSENKLAGFNPTTRDGFLVKMARYRIADLYYGMHDYVKAIESYRTVANEIKEEPLLSHARYRIGECFLALNDRKAAIAAFAELKSDDPKNIWARAAQSFIQSVQMEVKYGIRILN